MPLPFKRVPTIFLATILGIGILWLLAAKCPVFSPYVFRHIVAHMSNHDSRNKVVSGRNGWLFLQSELDYVVNPLPQDNISRISLFSRTLAAHGISLFVVPIPNKIDLYPEMLTQVSAPQPVNESREALLQKLAQAGVHVIDILPALDSAKSDRPVFDHFESHWTCAGIEAAAAAIAHAIDSSLKIRSIWRDTRYGACDTVLQGCADLPERISSDGKAVWYSTPVRQIRNINGTPYRDDPKSAILILGDSFTNHGRWWNAHLGAQIAFLIGHPTRPYSSILANTEGPSMYNRYPGLFPYKGVVIWAFSSRVLQYEMSDRKKK